jgi:hypothetical protein
MQARSIKTRKVAGKPCKDDEFCYCVLPPNLEDECGPTINGYNGYKTKQWEHNCENYKKYMACIEKTKDYCSPERPWTWRELWPGHQPCPWFEAIFYPCEI